MHRCGGKKAAAGTGCAGRLDAVSNVWSPTSNGYLRSSGVISVTKYRSADTVRVLIAKAHRDDPIICVHDFVMGGIRSPAIMPQTSILITNIIICSPPFFLW